MSVADPNPVHPNRRRRVAVVLSNPSVSTTTGQPVGFWWSELSHPWLVFDEHGIDVELFSPDGGACVADAMSDPNDASGYAATDIVSQGFLHTPALRALPENTRPASEIELDHFDAILVAGGQSPMYTMAAAHELHERFVAFHQAGKIAAALCHGSSILAFARLPSGEYLAHGKTVTGFANVEEDAADAAVWANNLLPHGQHLMPWRIEDRLRQIGANYVQAGPWRSFAVRDGNLITGQQNFSGAQTARLIVQALGA